MSLPKERLHMFDFDVQAHVALDLARMLVSSGYVVTLGEYDSLVSVEVMSRDGSAAVAVPLHLWLDDEADLEWAFLIRNPDGTFRDTPEARDGIEPPFGCPSIWDVDAPGSQVVAGHAITKAFITGLATGDGFIPLAGVRPGQQAAGFDPAPYPGVRPDGSWVVDENARLLPAMPDPTTPSGWCVIHSGGEARCLDDWLEDRGAEPMSHRVPVLSYGSNACPQKFVANGVSLPGVNLACVTENLAAVWCHDSRPVSRVPATLGLSPGSREWHVVSYLSSADFAALDRVEGRANDWYRLIRLTEGRVVCQDGAVLQTVYAYMGGREHRWPLMDAELCPVRVVDLSHAGALRAGNDVRYSSASGADLGPIVLGTPKPLDEFRFARVFVYGTLMPGQSRWPLLEKFIDGEPHPAFVRGTLYDTGVGYPALTDGNAAVSGYLVAVRPNAIGDVLRLLDQLEGVERSLFQRDLIEVHGTGAPAIPAWVYRASSGTSLSTRIDGWPRLQTTSRKEDNSHV